jgi:site-specific DNA-methyltransferase (cytosine-N4-specific)
MNVLRLRMKSYIQPFERRLALQELRAVAAAEPRHLGLFEETSTDFELLSAVSSAELANRLAYWETVESIDRSLVTMQSLRESTVNAVRNGATFDVLRHQLPFCGDIPFPNRRCLRYGPHGIHEYRGKFFPQLVRSLINVAATKSDEVIADPMSGSGTAVVEALLAGCRALGIDMNPLSVYLGQVKCRLLSASPSGLIAGYEQVCTELHAPLHSKAKRLSYLEALPDTDQEYLSGWFSRRVLSELDHISQSILRVTDRDARDLMRVSLSNILRGVSWQKEDDLRVRKEVRPDAEIDVRKEFLQELNRSVRSILAFLYQNGPLPKPAFEVIEGDARECASVWGKGSVDLLVTSPPYATALPYLDTDRLSLCYLGLLPRPDHRARDQLMIGNREVTERLRRFYWNKFEEHAAALPSSVSALIRRIERLNATARVGFRRKNLPALLAKYFFDMKDVIEGMYRVLKPRSFAFVIVGNNHTLAGGRRVDIPTASLLQDVAARTGFHVSESLPMEMLVSRDIFKKNAMASEEILAFYKTDER